MILVTGATGFIGRRLMKRLAETFDPKEILCLVYPDHTIPLEQSGRAVLDTLGIRYIPVDLVTGAGVEQIPRSPDIVLHLASNTDTGARDHSINDVGAKHLMDAIHPLAPTSTLIFTSTISASDHRPNPQEAGNEDSVLLRPYSEYGRKKLEAETYLRDRCKKEGFSLSILRVSATHGSGTRSNGLYGALATLAKRRSIVGRFDYPGRMTAMHVDDVADILTRLTRLPPRPGQPRTFLAHAEVLSVHEMSAAAHAALGIPFKPIHFPTWFWRLAQYGSPLVYALEPVLPHGLYNKLWQLTLLMNNGYNNVSIYLRETFPDKTYKLFKDHARDLFS